MTAAVASPAVLPADRLDAAQPTGRLDAALAGVFGFPAFRPHQREIATAILGGRDVFAVMPTGGGKSLCYQLPACLSPGVAVVVSPLISLMKDQVDAANANGIAAASLNSAQTDDEKREIHQALRAGLLRLLYISPERFNAPGFLDYLATLNPSFFAVDEAHCISEWGHDFRPDYLALSGITLRFPAAPVAAFTATATPRVAEDIVARLGLRSPHMTRASFNRPNLTYRILPKENAAKQIAAFIHSRPGEAGIVYRTTRKAVDATVTALRGAGIDARGYHAGLPDAERKSTQESFRHDRCRVVVATIAFGMGIDKPNVRYVVHGDLPKNIEGYYQETGRAGRDGEPADCVLFHSPADCRQLMRFNAAIPDPAARAVADEQLRRMAAFAGGDVCRRRALLAYFGEEYPEANCGGCDVCRGEVEREDATENARKALSAMARTGGRYGAGHIADILTGAGTEKIRRAGHDKLPTHGVGRDRDRGYWKRLVSALVAKGLADVIDPALPTPAVTEAGWELLRGGGEVMLVKVAGDGKGAPTGKKDAPARRRQGGGGSGSGGDLGWGPTAGFSMTLFKILARERNAIARSRNLPAYMIFADKTLREIARARPTTPDAFLAVSGVGQYRLRSYGRVFLDLIEGFLADGEKKKQPADNPGEQRSRTPPTAEGIKKQPGDNREGMTRQDSGQRPEGMKKRPGDNPGEQRSRTPPTAERTKKDSGQRPEEIKKQPADNPRGMTRQDSGQRPEETKKLGESELATRQLVARGLSVGEIAEERRLKPETVVTHIERLVECGVAIRPEQFMEPERLRRIGRLLAGDEDCADIDGGDVTRLEARLARTLSRLLAGDGAAGRA